MNENINKVIYGTSTLIDLTSDTVDPDRMYKGDTAHAADGSEIVGTAEITVDGTTLVMPEGLCDLIGTVDPETHHWIRPEGLPDLDSIYNDETNTLYMTVDATGRIPDPHVSFGVQGAYTVQIGHIQNGVFVADSTESKASNATFSYVWTPAAESYPIVKITGTGNITYFNWKTWTSADGHIYEPQYQAVIEWIGHCYNLTGDIRTPYFTEREKIDVNTCYGAFLTYRWQNAYSLQDLDVSMWDTSAWAITSLQYTWSGCVNLPYLDVSNWDTSNWVVTGLYATWSLCLKLEFLDLYTWNTSKWKVTNMYTTWAQCGRLKSLDVSAWDTSGWAVTSINQTWYRCWHLEYLDLSNWDTSSWKVTAMQYTWHECFALKYLNVSTWNTSGWGVTNLGDTWRYCYVLKYLDLSNWDTSNWKVTNLTSTWGDCHALEELDVSTWDTSEWAPTSLRYTWINNFALRSLDLSNWDVSNWKVNDTYSIESTWADCRNLEFLDVSTWNTSGWTVKAMTSTWRQCRKLRTLPIGNWDTSNWQVTTMTNTWYCCTSLEYLPIADWDTSNWQVTNANATFYWMTCLKSLDLSKWDTSGWTFSANSKLQWVYLYNLISLDISCFDLSKIGFRNSSANHLGAAYRLQNVNFGTGNSGKFTNLTDAAWSISDDKMLTRESLLKIFDILASGVSGKTLTLGTVNLNKLTAEEKAIATNKGWTLT